MPYNRPLELYDFYTHQIQVCDDQLEANYQVFKPQVDLDQQPLPSARRTGRDKNSPSFDLRLYLYQITGVDLTQIDGVNVLTAQTVLAEIGLDMSQWPTVKHFTSWLGLCPHPDIFWGVKCLKTRTKSTQNRANKALRMAAQALTHSKSALGDYYRLMRARHGPAKAITAAAHKLARIIYHMLKHRQPFDPDRLLQNQAQLKQRRLKRLKRLAGQLDMDLVPSTT